MLMKVGFDGMLNCKDKKSLDAREIIMTWPLWKRRLASQDLPVHCKPFYTIDEYCEFIGKEKLDEVMRLIQSWSTDEKIAFEEYLKKYTNNKDLNRIWYTQEEYNLFMEKFV